MVPRKPDEEKEIERRRDEIARRMLNTPPKPRKAQEKKGDGPKESNRRQSSRKP